MAQKTKIPELVVGKIYIDDGTGDSVYTLDVDSANGGALRIGDNRDNPVATINQRTGRIEAGSFGGDGTDLTGITPEGLAELQTAKLLTLSADSMFFRYDSFDNPSPASQTISLKAKVQNIENPDFTWTVDDDSFPVYPDENDESILNIDVSDFGDRDSLSFTVTVEDESLSDTLTLVRLEDGATGKDAVTIILTNESHTYQASRTGEIDTDNLDGGATDIIVFYGTTRLTPVEGELVDDSFKVTATSDGGFISFPAENHIIADTTAGFEKMRIAAPANVLADVATITFDITARIAGGDEYNLQKVQSFSLSKAGDTGATGTDALSVKLEADDYQVAYDENGKNGDPAQVTVTATPQNHGDTVLYKFYVNRDGTDEPWIPGAPASGDKFGSSKGGGQPFGEGKAHEWSSTDFITIPAPTLHSEWVGNSMIVKVKTSEDGIDEVASDSQSIIATKDGSNAIVIACDNQTHVFPAENNGQITEEDYEDGSCTFEVYHGNSQMTPNAVFSEILRNAPKPLPDPEDSRGAKVWAQLGDNEFVVYANASDYENDNGETLETIDPYADAPVAHENKFKFRPAGMAADTLRAAIVYTFYFRDHTGQLIGPRTMTQTFTKGVAGAEGPQGPKGEDGDSIPGQDARVVKVTSDDYQVAYDEHGENPSTTAGTGITLTSTSQGHRTNYIFFRVSVNGTPQTPQDQNGQATLTVGKWGRPVLNEAGDKQLPYIHNIDFDGEDYDAFGKKKTIKIETTEIEWIADENGDFQSWPTEDFAGEPFDPNNAQDVTVMAEDTITVIATKEGSNAVEVIADNLSHNYIADAAGQITDYSGGEISFEAYIGNTQLLPWRWFDQTDTGGGPVVGGSGLTNTFEDQAGPNTFHVTAQASKNDGGQPKIQVGAVRDAGAMTQENPDYPRFEFDKPNLMREDTNTASITFTIQVKDSTGTLRPPRTLVQTITKTKDGSDSKLVRLSSDANAFVFDEPDDWESEPQEIKFFITAQNLTSDDTVSADSITFWRGDTDVTNDVKSLVPTAEGGKTVEELINEGLTASDGDSFSMKFNYFINLLEIGDEGYSFGDEAAIALLSLKKKFPVKVKLDVGGLSDSIPIVSLNGGTETINVIAPNNVHLFAANSEGFVSSDDYGTDSDAGTDIDVYKGAEKLTFEAKKDIVVDNDYLSEGFEGTGADASGAAMNNPATNGLWTNGTGNKSGDDLDNALPWWADQDTTRSAGSSGTNTGPADAPEGAIYAYTEASKHSSAYRNYSVIHRSFSDTEALNNIVHMRFKYHMHGHDLNSNTGIKVSVRPSDESSDWVDCDIYPVSSPTGSPIEGFQVSMLSGETHESTTAPWSDALAKIPNFDSGFDLRIVGVHPNDWAGDMAIDDIRFRSEAEPDQTEGTYYIGEPVYDRKTIPGDTENMVTVSVRQDGSGIDITDVSDSSTKQKVTIPIVITKGSTRVTHDVLLSYTKSKEGKDGENLRDRNFDFSQGATGWSLDDSADKGVDLTIAQMNPVEETGAVHGGLVGRFDGNDAGMISSDNNLMSKTIWLSEALPVGGTGAVDKDGNDVDEGAWVITFRGRSESAHAKNDPKTTGAVVWLKIAAYDASGNKINTSYEQSSTLYFQDWTDLPDEDITDTRMIYNGVLGGGLYDSEGGIKDMEEDGNKIRMLKDHYLSYVCRITPKEINSKFPGASSFKIGFKWRASDITSADKPLYVDLFQAKKLQYDSFQFLDPNSFARLVVMEESAAKNAADNNDLDERFGHLVGDSADVVSSELFNGKMRIKDSYGLPEGIVIARYDENVTRESQSILDFSTHWTLGSSAWTGDNFTGTDKDERNGIVFRAFKIPTPDHKIKLSLKYHCAGTNSSGTKPKMYVYFTEQLGDGEKFVGSSTDTWKYSPDSLGNTGVVHDRADGNMYWMTELDGTGTQAAPLIKTGDISCNLNDEDIIGTGENPKYASVIIFAGDGTNDAQLNIHELSMEWDDTQALAKAAEAAALQAKEDIDDAVEILGDVQNNVPASINGDFDVLDSWGAPMGVALVNFHNGNADSAFDRDSAAWEHTQESGVNIITAKGADNRRRGFLFEAVRIPEDHYLDIKFSYRGGEGQSSGGPLVRFAYLNSEMEPPNKFLWKDSLWSQSKWRLDEQSRGKIQQASAAKDQWSLEPSVSWKEWNGSYGFDWFDSTPKWVSVMIMGNWDADGDSDGSSGASTDFDLKKVSITFKKNALVSLDGYNSNFVWQKGDNIYLESNEDSFGQMTALVDKNYNFYAAESNGAYSGFFPSSAGKTSRIWNDYHKSNWNKSGTGYLSVFKLPVYDLSFNKGNYTGETFSSNKNFLCNMSDSMDGHLFYRRRLMGPCKITVYHTPIYRYSGDGDDGKYAIGEDAIAMASHHGYSFSGDDPYVQAWTTGGSSLGGITYTSGGNPSYTKRNSFNVKDSNSQGIYSETWTGNFTGEWLLRFSFSHAQKFSNNYEDRRGMIGILGIEVEAFNPMTDEQANQSLQQLATLTGNTLTTFTGQHKCVFEGDTQDIEGKIVSSTGKYDNMNFEFDGEDVDGLRHRVTPQEAVPVVSLCESEKDKKCFGVVCSVWSLSKNESILFGSAVHENNTTRYEINSLGEGGIWVSNIAGDLENGDYICSSNIPGYGMKQDDDILRNYTVAKITQDCTFDLESEDYDCKEVEHNGIIYKVAFVGCTYHCG